MDVEESNTSSEPKDESGSNMTKSSTEAQEMETVSPALEESPALVQQYRDPETRPVVLLSVKLIETYKHINKIYYEAKAKKLREQQGGVRGGVYNDGYDDQHYDYLIHGDEIFAERYILKHRIGKGSFGQVVCAYDRQQQCDVAIKIIKSKHAFAVQAKTEIKLLELTLQKDFDDEHNIVRLLDTFVYRKHQCLVFEMLSYNLYELLKNTKFRGVSLALVRKFAKQILRGLHFLARKDVNIIHCDLKPENILLRHPKRSAIKLIDFGSSCLATKKMYTYIQSRFYRSPEVLLGLPYSQKIDMWSLGCVLVEMHTGEPLFGGVDQLDQLNRIVNLLGMVPPEMVEESPEETRKIFFDKVDDANPVPVDRAKLTVTITDPTTKQPMLLVLKPPKNTESSSRKEQEGKSLEDVIGVTTGGPDGRRRNDVGHTEDIYLLFAQFIRQMLLYQPAQRASAKDALSHPYLLANIDFPAVSGNSKDNDANGSATASSNQSQSTADAQVDSSKVNVKAARSTGPNLVPRRRSCSAPRLLSNNQFSISSSKQGGGDSAEETTGPSAKKATPAEKNTSEQMCESGEAVFLESPSQSGEGGGGSDGNGPMETSEVDDEGTLVDSSGPQQE